MSLKNVKILHIEDDKSDAFLIEEILTKQGFQYKNVSKMSDALRYLQTSECNLILLDLNLLDISGLDNVRCIREENPNLPIVVLTGSDNDDLAREALTAGAQEYLFKGDSNDKILKRIITSSILRKQAERKLYKRLQYDPLTGLPNRMFFQCIAQTLLKKAQRHKYNEAIMFLDMNGFKQINDRYGHEIGNDVLKITAQRIQKVLRSCDVVARYAGDEFMVYLDGQQKGIKHSDCVYIAQKILSIVKKPMLYNEKELNISLSIGVARFPEDGDDFATLVNKADEAMYVAKNNPDIEIFFCK